MILCFWRYAMLLTILWIALAAAWLYGYWRFIRFAVHWQHRNSSAELLTIKNAGFWKEMKTAIRFRSARFGFLAGCLCSWLLMGLCMKVFRLLSPSWELPDMLLTSFAVVWG